MSGIEKLAFILKDNKILLSALINALSTYPLESYKLNYYAKIFSDKKLMLGNMMRHSDKLRWQIMRIYRNRCMIVHNGNNFPYLNSILENLHYYVDELFNYIFSKIEIGINELEAIFSCARIKEIENLHVLEDKNVSLTDNEYYDLIFQF